MMAPAAFANSSTHLYVKTTGSDAAVCSRLAPCQTISHAISVAPSGATISVGAGTYNESLVITKPLTLVGSGSSDTIVNGWGKDPGAPYAGTVYIGSAMGTTGGGSGGTVGGNVKVTGFTFENPNPDQQTFGDDTCLQPILIGVYDGSSSDHIKIAYNNLIEGNADPDSSIDGPIGIDTFFSTASLDVNHNDISGVWQGALLEDNGPSRLNNNVFADLIPFNYPATCSLSAATTSYGAEGLAFLADEPGTWTNQEAGNNTFTAYAGDGIDMEAGYQGAPSCVMTCPANLSDVNLRHNRFNLDGLTGANAIGLFAFGGSLSNIALSRNHGSVTAPTVAYAESTGSGGTITGVTQTNESIS